ncbi:DUF5056 domain-containing protein [Dyella sedimenti]|uniref:DUF5056 domain-containing protein n=1 Tax=Dyella sedimenti TaxID=2919947 RepID=UPI001FAA6E28|nr:DUF5056 domain-containing protein [Dyella sedimenti]
MNDPNTDDAIDSLLRRSFDGPVADDGFCDRVMRQLPPRRARLRWPLAAGILCGMATCWLSLWLAPWLHVAWQNWQGNELTPALLALLLAATVMSLLAACWALAEATER